MNNLLKAILSNLLIIAVGVSIVYFFSNFNEPKSSQQDKVIPVIGKQAPLFKATTYEGTTVSLGEFKGKTVVLEWKNHKCPFVKKHYSKNNMQQLQKSLTQKGVIWLSIISSAPGKQGHLSPQECKTQIETEQSFASTVLLDESGKIGRLYDAKTTPHMFVINPEGTLVYMGAIDSIRSANPDDISKSTNYVVNAVNAIAAKTAIEPSSTAPYGCSVKY